MILAGDIGGTKTFLARFVCEGEAMRPVAEAAFPSRHYPDIEAVLQEFLREREAPVQRACFGVAGPVLDGRCETTNLPWIVDARRIGQDFGVPSVALLNDLEATGYGIPALAEQDQFILNPGQEQARTVTGARGNRAIIAAGTGLGEVLLFWDGFQYRPSASEGGHCDFAPSGPLQAQLLDALWKRYPHVSVERVLSGPGLMNIYHFLKETGAGEEPSWLTERLAAAEEPAAVVSETALAGKADLCVKALDLFVSVYGAEAGNLVLKTLATGGIYLAGGIAPKILEKLRDGTFMKAFLDKGRFSPLMEQIPVRVILNERAALLGAARYACFRDEKRSG
ncbi:MAG: glucokinase [Candidatus Manganitrophaceae bacterium]|nr:MAG: glucokinase [Candidatus Manganitrophaceae bacterium]